MLGKNAYLSRGGSTRLWRSGTRGGRELGCLTYLIRLSNTAFQEGFVFSIDNHVLQIVEADFVPVQPFTTHSVLVAIGQRYNVIVEAKPQTSPSRGNPIPSDRNFWLRMW